MRITAIILLAACLQVSAKTTAQRISITVKNASLEKIFSEIEQKSNYVFTYDALLLKGSKPVTIEMTNVAVEDILQATLKNQALDYSILNNTVFIKRKVDKSKMENMAAPAINNVGKVPEVTGTVMDETGQPLSGASIKLNNGKVVAITDAKGQFKLKEVSSDATIIISFTGYAEKAVPLNGKASFKVSMSVATNKLDEAQVIAYGTTTNRLNTGDVTTVTGKEIDQQPVGNVLEALEGRVPGLVITQATGVPGGGFTVQVRGQNSITNGNDPFYVIDGVPYNSELPGSPLNGSLHNGNPLNFINPYDIESVEILKDADATAIYGSRASNGAILITTKKGKAGAMKLNLNLRSGLTSPDRDISLMNTPQYLAMRHEAFNNDGAVPNPNEDYDLTFWDTTRYTNWSKVLTQNTARFSDAEASVSGGNTNMQYLIGGGYNKQTTGFPTLLPGDGADQKGSVHFNINSQSADKKFRLTFTGSYLSDKNTVQTEDFSTDRLGLAPDAPPLFNPDGTLNWAPLTLGQAGTWTNPYSNLNIKYKGQTSNLVGNAILSYMLLTGLELKASLGYTNTQTDEVQTYPTTFFDPGEDVTSGYSYFNSMNTHSWIVEPQIDYTLRLGKGILTTLVGNTFHENNSSLTELYATGFASDALLENSQAATNVYPTSNSAQYKYEAVFGRINYNWDDKYLLNITARRDGSSRFGPGKQFGDFGALGAGWIFSKGNFFQDHFKVLSFGKLRASYGTTGNDQIGDYKFLNLYTTTSYPYNGSQGLYPASLFNPDLAWEIDKKLEGGLELGFLKDRLIIQASYYRNRSNNQLVNTPVSVVTGFSSLPSNLPALVQNKGEELVINTINIKTKNFSWSSSLNLTIPRNKLLAFPNLANSGYSNTYVIGQPLSIIKTFHLIGVNDTTGIYQFSDSKGSPTYKAVYPDDLTRLVNVAPKYYGGFQNSFRYKGVSLDILFQFVHQLGQNIRGAYSPMVGQLYNEPVIYLDRWQKQGDIKPYERFSQSTSFANGSPYLGHLYMHESDFAYSDASFIRLKNLALSWDLPSDWKRKCHFETFRIYVQGQNMLTFTKYLGIDPESQGTGLPPVRVITTGIQISL